LSNQNPKVSNVENKPVIVRLIAVFVILGLMVGTYFLGRADAVPAELADINRKIDSLSSSITEQQRQVETEIARFGKLIERVSGAIVQLGARQAAITEGLGRMATRLSELDSNIRGALDKLADTNRVLGSNDDALRELFRNLQRLQALIGPENTRPTE
jgi:chromosome segregation ATPase